MRRRLAALLCSAVFCFCACSQESTAVQQEAHKHAPAFAPLTEIRDGRKNIYIIVKDLESSYWKVVLEGAKDAGKNLNCNVYYSGTYAETDWDQQAALLENCIESEADAVIVAPDDSVKLASKVSEVYNSGIPVILVDTTANTEQYSVCYMTDNLSAGQDAAEEMINIMHRKGHSDTDRVRIGIMVNTLGSQTVNERVAGFFQYWTQNAPENWTIVTDIPCFEGTAEETVPYAEELLEDHPDITGVYGTNFNTSAGIAKALEDNERTDIGMVGFDYSDEILRLVRDTDYEASTIIQRQYDMSYNGVRAALSITDGNPVPVKYVESSVLVVNKESLPTLIVQNVLNRN